MVIEQIGLKIGNLGREFGGWMGKWAIGFEECMGNSAIGLAKIIEGMNLLRSIQMFGFYMMIIVGLALIGIIIYNFNRTDTHPDLAT